MYGSWTDSEYITRVSSRHTIPPRQTLMRLIEQYSLTFSRSGSNKVKVFEIDLCEVGAGRFVVNYRYGRQGRALLMRALSHPYLDFCQPAMQAPSAAAAKASNSCRR